MRKKGDFVRVWDVIENVSVCMLTTKFGGGLRARPLEARPDRDAGLIFFVTDIHSAKEDEIEAAPDVGLVFVDSNNNAYLSITGRAWVVRDAEKIKTVSKERRGVVAGRPERSGRMFVADRTIQGGIVGWAVDRCCRCIRVHQGKVDRR
jgi:hypothetical protein